MGTSSILLLTTQLLALLFARQINGLDIAPETNEPPPIGPLSDCRHVRDGLLATSTPDQVYIPICDTKGRYLRLQCFKPAGTCWCVDKHTGEKIENTVTEIAQGPPKCAKLPIAAVSIDAGPATANKPTPDRTSEQKNKTVTVLTKSASSSQSESKEKSDQKNKTVTVLTKSASSSQSESKEKKTTVQQQHGNQGNQQKPSLERNGHIRPTVAASLDQNKKNESKLTTSKSSSESEQKPETPSNQKSIMRPNVVTTEIGAAQHPVTVSSAGLKLSSSEESSEEEGASGKTEHRTLPSANGGNGDNVKYPALCRAEREKLLREFKENKIADAWLRECDAEGNYVPLQCYGLTRLCLCVDKNTGSVIKGSEGTFDQKPDCSNVNQAVGTTQVPAIHHN